MLDLGWVLADHRDKADDLVATISEACERAERSKRFIDIQLNPALTWKGWPQEVAEEWLAKRPSVLSKYLNDEATVHAVGAALSAHFQNTYRAATGAKPGPEPLTPVPGLHVPAGVSDMLDSATWDAMRKMGATPDRAAIRQAVKIPAPTDVEGDDTRVVILSAGTVTGDALEARYVSIRGDLYWSDVRNTLELWVRARPELVRECAEYIEAGEPRAWEPGGEWMSKGPGDRREHDPLLLLRVSAHRVALRIISQWKQEGTVSLDAVLAGGEEALADVQRVRPERVQHKPLTGHEHYAWGLRDRVDCYQFPVDTSRMGV